MWLLRAGGLPGIFVVVFGLVALVTAAMFARAPTARRLEFIRRMTLATLFSVGTGVTACVAAALTHLAKDPELSVSPELHLYLMQGLGEAMAPAILGFTLLSLVQFVAAVGIRRMPLES